MGMPCRLAFTLTTALSTLTATSAQSSSNAKPVVPAQIQMLTAEARQNPGILYVPPRDLAGFDSGLGTAMPQPGETCFTMREYHFSRESKTSDALKLDGSSTCQTAKSFQLKKAEAQGAVLQR